MMKFQRWFFIAPASLAVAQVVWWAYLIISQQDKIAGLLNTEEAFSHAQNYHFMIFSEALFFVSVLLVAIWGAYRSMAKELALQRSQTDFLGAITHELKTPLTNVRLCLDTLERPNLKDDAKNKYINRAQLAVDQLLDEIETILTLSNKERLVHEAVEFDVNQMVDETIVSLDPNLVEKVHIHFTKCEKSVIKAPYHQSRLIFRNLLDNAIKYSSSPQHKSEINIVNKVMHNQLVTLITDNGIGMTTDEIRLAFTPFYRGEMGKKISPSGTGLGLSLVKRLAESVGLEISLESNGRDHGTTASILWPGELT